MEAYPRSVMCGRANNTFSHAARQMLPARRLSQTLTEEFICIVCSALVRHCACICSHFSWAHIPWSIHIQYTTTGGESECSSVCPEPPDRRKTYRYLQCLLMVFSALTHAITSLSSERAHLPPPLAQTHTDNAGLCVNHTTLCLHTPNHAHLWGELNQLHYWTSDNWTMTLPTVQSSLDHVHTWWICNGMD